MSLVFWDIVEESLDEAEFLWRRRDLALDAPNQGLADLETWVEDRLTGAIDGVCVPGAAVVDRLLAPALASDELARVSAAAHCLLMDSMPAGAEAFTAAFLDASGSRLAALRAGLELAPIGEAHLLLAARIKGAPEAARAAFLDACSFVFLARIAGVARAVEPGHLYSQEPHRGEGLAATFRAVFEAVPARRETGSVTCVYAGLNGESFWAKEWGVAQIRSADRFAKPCRIVHPVDRMGDPGAALGPVMVGLAALDLGRDRDAGSSLVWCSSDRDDRAAALLVRWSDR